MIHNSPYQSLLHTGITIEGYSRAMVQTVWRVPQWHIGFDMGALPWQFLNTPIWFITHAHLDHLAALPLLVSRRAIVDAAVPTTVYMPDAVVDDAWAMLKSWERLDRGSMSCTIKGLAAGDEVAISREHVVKAYSMRHPVPALGYIVWERRQKLKAEYQHCSSEQMRDLKLAGAAITEERRMPLLGYTGDTSPPGLDDNPEFFQARILIVEMSFVRVKHPRDKIHAFGHMHIDDFIERAERFQNEIVIASHVSSRYEIDETKRAIAESMPEGLRERMHVWGVDAAN
jgi:ribonuclease Z